MKLRKLKRTDYDPQCGWEFRSPVTNMMVSETTYKRLIASVKNHFNVNKLNCPDGISVEDMVQDQISSKIDPGFSEEVNAAN